MNERITPGHNDGSEQALDKVELPLYERPELLAAAEQDERLRGYLGGLKRAEALQGEMVDIYKSMAQGLTEYARERGYFPPEPPAPEQPGQ